jgi:hypothetical protein
MTGYDEELLAGLAPEQGPAALVSELLSRCVTHIGPIAPISAEHARALLVADRQMLLVRLHEVTFGHQVEATVRCPWPNCAALNSAELSLRDLPVYVPQELHPSYTVELSPEAVLLGPNGDIWRSVCFRLPTGADQEAVTPRLRDGDAHALTALLGRCLLAVGPADQPGEQLASALSARARREIEAAMARAAPALDLTMEGLCQECGRPFAAALDIQSFVLGEARVRLNGLYQEVHYLAYHYHWSEHEIMSFTRAKRRGYIEMLAEVIGRLNDGA